MNVTWEMDIEDLDVAVVFELKIDRTPAIMGSAINPPMGEWFSVVGVDVSEVQTSKQTWSGNHIGNVLQEVLVHRFWNMYANGEDELINEFAKIKHDAAEEASREAYVI